MFPCHGQCAVWLKLLHSSTVSRHSVGKTIASLYAPAALCRSRRCRGGGPVSGGGSGFGWSGLLCLLASLRCIVCLLGLLLGACFRLSLPLLGSFTLLQLAPCFGSCLASRGHHFALGTGGFKQSFLVGGIGPVYSLPKYCFKPFRRLSAVGFVLGWHREPHSITTLQAPFSIGYCRTHGGNHRGWTSCGDR